jgi:hypothetical protein
LLTSPLALLDADNEHDVEIHGFISAYQSNTNFIVNGIQIDASNARITGGSLASGVRVEVHGSLSNSILVATKVETPSNSDEASRTFEFHGTVSALDATAQTFVLHGLTFQYNNSTNIQGVTLANGVSIEVKATRSSGSWVATEISSDT